MTDKKALIRALRCSATAGRDCDAACPYLRRDTDKEIRDFLIAHPGRGREDYPEDFWESCDVDSIALDAADLLESYPDA